MSELDALDFNWLLALSHLLETSSVTQAARRAGVGQPAMSRTLARLRTVLKDPILVQVGRKWQLSERAERLRPQVREAIGAIRDVLRPDTTFDPRTSDFEVRMAANDHAVGTVLLPWFLDARKNAPNLTLRVEPVSLASIGALAAGEIDFAIGPRLAPAGLGLGQFVAREIVRDRFVCAMRRGHPCARKRWSLKAYLGCEHVVVTTGRPGPAAVDAALEERGMSRRVAAVVPSFLVVPALLDQSDFVATLPESLLMKSGPELVLRPAPIPLPALPLYLAWHPRFTADVRHRWLREVLLRHHRSTSESSSQSS